MKELLGDSPFAKIPYLPDILAHPRWLISFLRDGGVPKLQNVVVPGKGALDMLDVATSAVGIRSWPKSGRPSRAETILVTNYHIQRPCLPSQGVQGNRTCC